MNRVDYINKMFSLLSDNDTYETVNSNPLRKWQANFNRELKLILGDFPDLENRFKSYRSSYRRRGLHPHSKSWHLQPQLHMNYSLFSTNLLAGKCGVYSESAVSQSQ